MMSFILEKPVTGSRLSVLLWRLTPRVQHGGRRWSRPLWCEEKVAAENHGADVSVLTDPCRRFLGGQTAGQSRRTPVGAAVWISRTLPVEVSRPTAALSSPERECTTERESGTRSWNVSYSTLSSHCQENSLIDLFLSEVCVCLKRTPMRLLTSSLVGTSYCRWWRCNRWRGQATNRSEAVIGV